MTSLKKLYEKYRCRTDSQSVQRLFMHIPLKDYYRAVRKSVAETLDNLTEALSGIRKMNDSARIMKEEIFLNDELMLCDNAENSVRIEDLTLGELLYAADNIYKSVFNNSSMIIGDSDKKRLMKANIIVMGILTIPFTSICLQNNKQGRSDVPQDAVSPRL